MFSMLLYIEILMRQMIHTAHEIIFFLIRTVGYQIISEIVLAISGISRVINFR